MAADFALRPLRPDFCNRSRLRGAPALALGHVQTPLNDASATSRCHHPDPAEAQRRWRGRGASRSGSVSVTAMHALFKTKVEWKVTPPGEDYFCCVSLVRI